MIEKLKGYKIILASQSPRRKELLKGLDIPFEIADNFECDESYPGNINLNEVAPFLAQKKSAAYPKELKENEILITSDTLVKCNNELLGKPDGEAGAIEMLKKISGRKHEVITGVCLRNEIKKHVFSVLSNVYFTKLNDEEITYYVKKYKPFDKAGAYGIQEWIGYVGIERIEGSYYNVMGLPVSRLWKELINFTE